MVLCVRGWVWATPKTLVLMFSCVYACNTRLSEFWASSFSNDYPLDRRFSFFVPLQFHSDPIRWSFGGHFGFSAAIVV